MLKLPTLLRSKTVLLTGGLVFLATAAVGILNFNHVSKIAYDTSVEGLAGATRLTALKFVDGYRELYSDINLLAGSPSIQGIVRSTRNVEIDPTDGSTTDQLQERLASVFRVLLKARPHYTQLRYIGVANDGMELVRVDQFKGMIQTTPIEKLQKKANEPYFQEGLNLIRKEVFFSEVTLNREEGKIDPNRIPTVRTVYPVYDEFGSYFGMVVINADFSAQLRDTFRSLPIGQSTYVTNGAGDYMHRNEQGITEPFEFHQAYNVPPPEKILTLSQTNKSEDVLFADGIVSYFVKQKIEIGKSNASIGVITQVSNASLLKPVINIQIQTALLAGSLVLGALFISTIVTRKLMAPLQKMTDEVDKFQFSAEPEKLKLPTDQQDEIGKLARSFETVLEALSGSEQRANAVVNNTVDGIIVIDEKGTLLSFNPACVDIFGYSEEEALGKNVRILMHGSHQINHDQYLQDYLETGIKKTIGFRREHLGLCKDKTTFPLELAVSEISVGGTTFYSGILRNISLVKQQEAEIQSLIASMKRSNDELDNFAYIASHDLKEPLRAINNHASFLMEDYENALEEDGVKRLNRMKDLTARMETLISDLHYFSRLGHVEKSQQPSNANDMITNALEMLGDLLTERNVKLTVQEDMPVIECEAVRVTEVFRNLIINAIKYCEAEQPIVEIGFLKRDTPIFYVKDNGIGIAEEFHTEVFRIFKRLNNKKRFAEGSGAGLSFVKKIIETHGGEIWIESELGEGTTFFFTLAKGINDDTEI